MQSPKGEWPTGGRSSQHQWNDAVQCALYEMRASIHWQNGEFTLVYFYLLSITEWILIFLIGQSFQKSRQTRTPVIHEIYLR